MLRTAILPIVLSFVVVAPAFAQSAGDLDPTFDADGRQVLPIGGRPQAVLVQPDGKIVLAGIEDEDFAVWRLNPDGSVDPGFADDALADFGASDWATSAALQPDGKVLVAGSTGTAPGIARFTAGGALDPTFDPGGADGPGKKLLVSDGALSADGIVVQADGRIAIVGSRWSSQKPADFVITRLKANGAPDDAKAPEPADFGGDDFAVAGAAAPGGKIVVVGTTKTPTEQLVALARYEADGSLDKTFAGTGKKTLGPGKPVAVTAQPDGKVLVTLLAENGDLTVVRVTDTGEVDESFGQGGTSERAFDGEKLAYDAAAVAGRDGTVYVAGTPLGATAFGVARLQAGGAHDPSFGAGGVATFEFPALAVATAAAVQPDGKVVVAGATLVGVSARLAVVRVLAEDAPPPRAEAPGPATPRTPRCGGRPATIVGTAGRDTLRGTRRADVVVALGGRDTVLARGGNDVVCGGAGNDRLRGGPGRDLLDGGPGRDRLGGDAGRDRCRGAGGRDRAAGCERRRSVARTAARPPSPDVPADIAVPEGHRPYLTVHATGVQIYACNGQAWTLAAPRANLYDPRGKLVGTHDAGPSWQTNDGSTVVASRVAGVNVDPTAVDWLLLAATPTAPGRLGKTTYIQRIDTTGGRAPATACTAGERLEVPYSAEYVFWRAGGR